MQQDDHEKYVSEPGKRDPRYWPDFYKEPQLVLDQHPLLKPGNPIFTMGSCFAAEIRSAFQGLGYTALPYYAAVSYDRKKVFFDTVPYKRDFTPHYDTFVMRQEFEAALGEWPDRDDGYWSVKDKYVNEVMKSDIVYQDPFRKKTYATNLGELQQLASAVTQKIRDGIIASPILVITLGLTEVWRDDATGRYMCRASGSGGGGGEGISTFHQSTFMENYQNVKATLDLLFKNYPDKHVIISVSPVPLERTFSTLDVATANTESKSILRAVAGQICREYKERVHYFPSYDAATAFRLGNVFMPDGRHITKDFANKMVSLFQKFYNA